MKIEKTESFLFFMFELEAHHKEALEDRMASDEGVYVCVFICEIKQIFVLFRQKLS